MPDQPDLCVGPVDWPQSFRQAVAEATLEISWRRYPGAVAPRTLRGVASWFGVSPEQVLITRGVMEALRLVFTVAGSDRHTVAIPAPSFIGFTEVASAVGVKRLTYPVESMMGPSQDRRAWRRLAVDPEVTPVVCTPNNPTGHELGIDSLLWVVRQFQPRPTIVDLTYDPFSVNPLWHRAEALTGAGAVLLLSLSKAFCLAGVRLGVVIADPRTIATLSRRVERFHLDLFQLAVLDQLVEEDTMSRLAAVRDTTIRLREAIAESLAAICPHLPMSRLAAVRDTTIRLREAIAESLATICPHLRVTAVAGNFVACRISGEFPAACCRWLVDDLECGYFRSLDLLRVTASDHNRQRLGQTRGVVSGPDDLRAGGRGRA